METRRLNILTMTGQPTGMDTLREVMKLAQTEECNMEVTILVVQVPIVGEEDSLMVLMMRLRTLSLREELLMDRFAMVIAILKNTEYRHYNDTNFKWKLQ